MGNLYFSRDKTVVLRCTAIPPCPTQYSGSVVLFDVDAGVTPPQICDALSRYGEVRSTPDI